MSYPFYFEGYLDNIYSFETDLGLTYNVKFKPSDYLIGDVKTEYSHYLFEFVIELIYNPLKRNPPLDKLVSTTIAVIIIDFYYKKNEAVSLYICDSSDGKQELRNRKFHDWFYSHEHLGLTKVDQKIIDSQGIVYPMSVILKNNNPYFIDIVMAFNQIANENSK
jgi:hypothetical protein